MPELFVDCAIPVQVDTLFTYRVPTDLQPLIRRGVRVSAPFGKRTVIGLVHSIAKSSDIKNIRSILDVIDDEPAISEELLRLADWMSDYYLASRGEVIKTMLVRGATQGTKRTVRLIADDVASLLGSLSNAPRQAEIVRALEGRDELAVTYLKRRTGIRSIHSLLFGLAERGAIAIHEQSPGRGMKPKYEKVIRITDDARVEWSNKLEELEHQPTRKSLARQGLVLQTLVSRQGDSVQLDVLMKSAAVSLSTVQTMARKKIIRIESREVPRTSTHYSLSSPAVLHPPLNRHQQTALDAITAALNRNAFQPFLLYGITGSGKTQVYIEAIRHALAQNKSAIVLVPEISLTPQIVGRFRDHFGEHVVALHSRMSAGERYDAWRLTRDGKYSIVIGPRSAIFAPLKNLGLIAVDEEHEPSYKQFDQTPRYHARDVALVRAQMNNAVVVLGSATPSFESYANAQSGKYTLLNLPERIDNAKLPTVEIVDMTAERRKKISLFREERKEEFKADPIMARQSRRRFEFSSVSDLLREKIENRLGKNEGIILLQNRRGFSPFIECPDCGYVEMCDRCSISMTYHLTKRHLRCHYCGSVKEPPDICPSCKGIDIAYRGIGTQRVEDELRKFFPEARIARMDLDTTTWRGSHDAILKKFADGEADILLGTQMVAKGLDFSRVTLVGVISADTQMLLPDFRSSERTFQLLTQVAGRAGRSVLAGEVVIQSYQPKHESLVHVSAHDFPSFFAQELALRQELEYPPFTRLALIEIKSEKEEQAMRHAMAFADLIRRHSGRLRVLGPAPAVITKIRNVFRWHIVVKDVKLQDPSGKHLHRALREALASYRSSQPGKSKTARLVVDVDPVGMM